MQIETLLVPNYPIYKASNLGTAFIGFVYGNPNEAGREAGALQVRNIALVAAADSFTNVNAPRATGLAFELFSGLAFTRRWGASTAWRRGVDTAFVGVVGRNPDETSGE